MLLVGISFIHQIFIPKISAAFINVMIGIEESEAPADGSPHPIRKTRESLEKLISRMDSLESDFDKLAEKSSTLSVMLT